MSVVLDFLSDKISIETVNLILLIGIVLFGGTLIGRLFQKLKFPQVVGYIGLGVILGQTVFSVITHDTIISLRPFSTFALGLIGFMIGGELKINTIRKFGKQFLTILLLESFGAFFVVSGLITLVAFLFFKDIKIALPLGLLMGAISSATAPAATTDVLWENKTRGPLTTMILGIVAMDDAVALLLFAVASSLVGIITGQAGGSLGLSMFELLWEVGVAIALGVAIGFILYIIIRNFVNEDKILAFSIGAILLLIGISQVLGVDVILASMTMGFFIANFSPRRSKQTFHLVEQFTPPVYILFFVMVGASLNIKSLTFAIVIMAAVYLVGRIAGKALGSVIGATISKAPKTVRKFLPYCLLSQAGVAIGLSIVAGNNFPGKIGDLIVLIVTATTFVVQLLGPLSVKYAVTKAGEVGLNFTEQDLIRQSKAKDLADKDIPVIKENETLNNILNIFAQRDNLYYPVANASGNLVGILSIEKLKDTFIASDFSDFLLAHDIMENVLHTFHPDDPAIDIYEVFQEYHVASVPVVDEKGMVAGMIEYRRMQQLIASRLSTLKDKAKKMEEV